MASRQVMRSVSADFCASAGAAIASVVQAASSRPRSQVSDRIYCPLNSEKRRRCRNIRRRGTEATRMPSSWLRPLPPRSLPSDGAHLSLVNGRQQPLQETVDGLRIDPANHGHEIVLLIDIDHVGAVADVGKSGGRSTRPALLVSVKK